MSYLILALGFLILLLGGKFLVDGASAIAARLGLSPGLIGLTIVAFGTSAPELLVSVTASLKGASDITIGNVIGSNISNISLVLGISAIIFPIYIQKSTLKLDYPFTLISSVLFYIMAFNGVISLYEGIILFSCFIALNWYFFKTIERVEFTEEEAVLMKKQSPWLAILQLVGGAAGLYFGSELVVGNASLIARNFGVSERIIGVTIIAIGTSLPELVTSVMAALKKETEMALGNILGSNIMNVFSIIGITALIKPIDVATEFIFTDFVWMLGFTILLLPIMRINYIITRIKGAGLLIGYLLYIYILIS
ncbi:calcium/sodium antiporter [Cyclobacterium sp. 1_MG-2023]|uniref:calcium/sodium antiporter n=1 Tax=Cyclobacterium sp. 1_MG-2023 TaxID=3062681 RepID=UPI0026E31306|nr:calcium/sodium antiporter [Cyclobacterium sp. 1_MG-2023]MDO6437674.1 calcium/sodium antiporter [Cyclobacterium sp. 1_MG-2023]